MKDTTGRFHLSLYKLSKNCLFQVSCTDSFCVEKDDFPHPRYSLEGNLQVIYGLVNIVKESSLSDLII